MHFSLSPQGAGRRQLSGVFVALLASLLLLGLLSDQARAAANTYCAPPSGTIGTTTYTGASGGQWGTGDNWSNGQPDAQCDAVIPANVTVTLSTVTQAGTYGNGNGAATDGLTIEPGATVIVEGESSGVQGNWSNATNLGVGLDGLVIDQGATLDIEASNATAPGTQSGASGGSANVTVDSGSSGPASLTNNGTIVASTNDAAWGESLNDGGTLTNNGSITDESGLLTLQGQNYAYVLNNAGTFNVAPGASTTMIAGDGSVFTNTGSVANQGAFTLQQSMHWNQTSGSTSGNPIELTGGETLVDAAGSGAFEVIDGCGGGSLTGTVPAGQTITVQGVTQGCSGNTGQQSAMTLGSGSNPPAVANHGTIVLNASGTGNTSGGSAQILGAELDNYGTLDSTITDSSFSTTLSSPLVNEAGGTVNVTGGELHQTNGTPTANAGTVNIGPGSTWLVQGGSFTNSGTLGLQIASATSFGNFNLTVGGKFNAGGTLAPTLVSGYQPAKGTELPIVAENGGSPSGSFGSVTGGFSADYSKESASPGYLGLIYGAAASTVVKPSVKKLSGGARKMVAKLSCAKGAKTSCTYTFTGTVGKTKVASGHGTVKAGKTVSATLKLNKAGLALLKKRHRLRVKLVISAGGKTIKTSTVTVTETAATKKKKKK
jgi:hypothetical protein